MSGDKLSIFLALAGFAFGSMTAALTAPKGWRARALWLLTAVFVLTTAFFVWPPTWIHLDIAWAAVLAAIMPVTVIVVLMMQRPIADQKAQEQEKVISEKIERKPEDAARARVESRWKPDISLKEAAMYIISKTRWRPEYGQVSAEKVAEEIHRALYKGEITAWGRLHPDSEEFQIATVHWNHADLKRIDGYAMLRQLRLPIHGLRLSRGEIEAVWPPKN